MAVIINKKRVAIGVKQLPGGMTYDADKNVIIKDTTKVNEYVFNDNENQTHVRVTNQADDVYITFETDEGEEKEINFSWGQFIGAVPIDDVEINGQYLFLNNADTYDLVVRDSYNVLVRSGGAHVDIGIPTNSKIYIDYVGGIVIANNLEPEYISEGITILGVTGTCKSMPDNALVIDTSNTEYIFKPAGTSLYRLFYYNTHDEQIQKVVAMLNTSEVTSMCSMFSYCTNLKTIPWIDTSKVTDMSTMFQKCINLTSIPALDTSKVTNMSAMFNYCDTLTSIPFIDTSNVTDMSSMFQKCINLTSIPALDTSKVTNMRNMFMGCSLVSTLVLDTSSCTSMLQMFQNCVVLKTIDLTSMSKVIKTINSKYTFANCYSLTKLIIRNMTTIPVLNTDTFEGCYHFEGTVDETYNPEGLKDGRIYVPDDYVERLKAASIWSTYADCIVPLSTLEE